MIEMWGKSVVGLIFFYLIMASARALPANVPRYKQLGHNCSSITDRSSIESNSTTPIPFEYALLGQDPKDQHWYRVSLTPKTGKMGDYRAQFATRKVPPFNEQVAHKHDKTIGELLHFLESTEERNLLKVYRELLENEEIDQEVTNAKFQSDNNIEIATEEEATFPGNNNEANRQLFLVGKDEGIRTNTTTNSTESNNKMVNNFVYFIKGLK